MMPLGFFKLSYVPKALILLFRQDMFQFIDIVVPMKGLYLLSNSRLSFASRYVTITCTFYHVYVLFDVCEKLGL